MDSIYEKIHGIGIIPVIALENVEDAAPLANALCEGGIPAAEVTYRTACAKEVLAAMKKAQPDMLVGAGTVLTIEQVDSAIEAGATFIVSPGFDEKIVRHCQEKKIPVFPGVANASEVARGLSMGLTTLKFFPAEAAGGTKYLKALAGPYKQVKFMPTGGVNLKNLQEYLSLPQVVAVGGTWMIDKKSIENKDFDHIKVLCQEAVQAMLHISIKHMGINAEEPEAAKDAEMFAKLFGGSVRKTSKGYFGSDLVEVMAGKENAKGTYGHIAMAVSNVARARRYYESLGYAFDESTAAYDENGELKFIYFKDEFAKFRVHMIKG